MSLGFRALSLLDCAANGFLGFAVLCGAAFVFYRSKRAALYVALAGVTFMAANAFEWVVEESNLARILGSTPHFLVTGVFFVSHAVFFGGLALALHAMAQKARP